MSDLVERAAKHVAALNGHTDDWGRYVEEANDYVLFILEEAAKVAENLRDHENTDAWTITRAMAFNACATAIRKLAEKDAKGEK